MGRRSQAHRLRVHGVYGAPNITGILPDTATLAAVGAAGRTIATMSTTGGTAPFTYSIANYGGVQAAFVGNVLQTTGTPAGTVAAHTMSITVGDAAGRYLTETLVVTLT